MVVNSLVSSWAGRNAACDVIQVLRDSSMFINTFEAMSRSVVSLLLLSYLQIEYMGFV
jgi:hypothetical protein